MFQYRALWVFRVEDVISVCKMRLCTKKTFSVNNWYQTLQPLVFILIDKRDGETNFSLTSLQTWQKKIVSAKQYMRKAVA